MLKWAKERVRMLILHQAGVEVTLAAANSGELPAVIIAAAAQRATRRIVAISSTGLETVAAHELVYAPAYTPMRVMANLRRPGVHARWKEQNRVPFQKGVAPTVRSEFLIT